MLKSVWKLSSIVVLLLVAACGDLKDLKSASLYSVSGAVSGAVSSGITVTLVAGTTTTITTTDANGNFSFAGLTNGGSTITPTAPGYTFSPTSTAVTVNNGNVANINFVTAPVIVPTYSISGAVTGAPNVTVTLTGPTNGSATTDANGGYSFSGLTNGPYTVTPTSLGNTFAPTSLAVTVSNENVANINFTATAITYGISGAVTGASNVTVTLTGPTSGTTTPDANGNFSFANLQNGSFTITPTAPGYTFSPTSTAVTVSNANVANTNFTATAILYNIAGTVSGAISAGVEITLDGPSVGSMITDVNGDFSFTGFQNGTYTVVPSSIGLTFNPTSLVVNVNNGNVTGVNFTATAITYSISGAVTGAPNVTVTLTGPTNGSATTDANGGYSFSGLTNGPYTVTPTSLGNTFAPTSLAVTVSNENVANINFTATAITYGISGAVTGASNVTVTLTGPTSGTTTPDANGNFSFAGLQNGTHTITPSGAGYAFSPVDAVAIVSDADIANLNFVVPMLATGKLLYPCPQAICSKDLATGVETVLWGAYGAYPSKIVPVRNGQSVAFQEGNGIYLLSLATLTAQQVVWGGIDWTPGCSSEAQGRFDLSQSGDAVVFSSECTPIGTPAKRDIVLMKTDGTMFWSRVTDDNASESSPIIGSAGGVNDHLASYFVSNKNGGYDIWKQVVDLVNGVLVGDQTLFVSDVVKDETFFGLSVYNKSCISINAEYGQMAYMRRVDGMIHIITKPLDGGVEVDLGPGESPYWATSGEILYYASGYLWVVNPDGTGRKQVPLPSNLLYDLSRSRVRALSSIVLVP